MHISAAEYICKANYLVLEANYDEEMLKMGPYPQYLKERIAGPNGHMSNRETADFLAENINESLKYIWLCHLSKDNNHPELAYKTVELSLRNKGIIVGKDVPQVSKERKYFTVYIHAIAYIVSSVVRHFKSCNREIFQFHCLTFVQIVYAGR